MKEVERLKLAALAYWRLERHHMVAAIECKNSDVRSLTRSKMITDTEVKVSIADMQREITTKRYKHHQMSLDEPIFGANMYAGNKAHYFYFLVPKRLEEKALEVISQRYPYAGLLVAEGELSDVYKDHIIKVSIAAKRLRRYKATEKEIMEMGYGAANTALRYGNKLAEVHNG